MVDDVGDDAEHDRDDGRAAGTAGGEDKLAVLEEHGRRHGGERQLPGRDAVGQALDQAEEIGAPSFVVKSSISLFIRKPAPGMVTQEPKAPLIV